MSRKKFKHLSDGQRVTIESMLGKRESINAIARVLGKAASTIKREISKHARDVPAKANDCLHKPRCKLTRLCDEINHCASECSKKCPGKCYKICGKYEPEICEVLLRPPYVCNHCGGFNRCPLNKRIYRAKHAQDMYEHEKSECRSGAYTTEDELQRIADIVAPLLKKGQSPYHILTSHKEEIGCSLSTFYDWIERGLLPGVDPLDLHHKLRRKKYRKPKGRKLHNEGQYMTVRKEGRLYSDYLAYIEENDVPPAVQMDCVEGKVDEKPVILTLHFPESGMQLGFLLEEHTAAQVVRALDIVERVLGTELFQEAFPILLTDNGHEFSDIEGIETSCLAPTVKRTKVFFCEPNRSDQKGACENNHTLVRRIIKKGSSLRHLTYRDVRLVFNHINSQRRKKNRGKAAYDRAFDDLPKEFFERLGLKRIPDDQVNIKPSLIRDRLASRVSRYDERKNTMRYASKEDAK